MDNKQKIINYLGKNRDKFMTMHELSVILSIPYASFYRTVEAMKDLLSFKNAGKSKLISLDLENPIIRSHLAVSSDEERKDFLQKHPIIYKICQELDTRDVVLLFGSYAKGKETDKSDIDLLIINKDGKRSLSFSKYELLFKVKINPIFVTGREFRLMLKEKGENVGKQALKNHIILNNPEGFWSIVYGKTN